MDRETLLNKRLNPTHIKSIAPYKKQFRTYGEPMYDFTDRSRTKRPYSRNTGNRIGQPGRTQPVSSTVPTREPVPGTSTAAGVTIAAAEMISAETTSTITTGNSEVTVAASEIVSAETTSTIISGHSEGTPSLPVTELPDFLDEMELYMSLLKADPSVTSVSEGIALFLVLPELDYGRSYLQKDHLILIQRKAVSFNQEETPRWIYMCSCQPHWSRELQSSCSQYCISHSDFLLQYPECLHRRVSSRIFQQYDNLYQIHPTDHFLLETDADHIYSSVVQNVVEAATVNGVPVVRVWGDTSKTFGLVTVLKKKYFCFCCRKNFCDHTKPLRMSTATNVELESCPPIVFELFQMVNTGDEASNNHSRHTTICHSQKPIPFSPTDATIQCFKSGLMNSLVFIPTNGVCRHCGGQLDNGDPVINQWVAATDVMVVTNTQLDRGTVCYRPCTICDSITLFDGLDRCFLNMGSFLVGHDVLRSYMHSFLHGKRPLHTFHSVFVDVHADYGNLTVPTEFTYHKLRVAWLAFLNLLDFDINNGFSCPDCDGGDGPDIVICDGTSVAFQRRMWPWKEVDTPDNTKRPPSSRFRDRLFISDPALRRLLHRFAAGGEVLRGKRTDMLLSEEKKSMFIKLKSYPTLETFLHSIDDGGLKLHRRFQNFVTSLASQSPVCGYIHPTEIVGSLITDLVSGVKIKMIPQKWSHLHNELPIVFEILENDNNASAPSDICPLLLELWNLATFPFKSSDDIDDSSALFDSEVDMAFFPSLQVCRPRGSYQMDAVKTQKTCSKKYKGHPSLLPGVFTLYCPHGVCYGFQVMATHESPNVPFTIFRTRFKRAPKIIIYDNACALHSYCLNRDPVFFKNTIFLIDRLHWDNHGGCSCGYCLSLYPGLAALNSQVNEQGNAGLKRIKDQLSYMTANNFMRHCSFYLWNKNRTKLKK